MSSTSSVDAAAAAAATRGANKQSEVHHALRGPHAPRSGNAEGVAQRLEELVERSFKVHEGHVGISEVGGVQATSSSSSEQAQKTTLDRLSGYFSSLGCNILPNSSDLEEDFVSWKMGNYVAIRNGSTPEERIFESMPLYVRVGMHLLFYSSKKHSLLRYSSIEALLKRMSEREGEIYDDASRPSEVQAFIKSFIETYAIDTKDLQETDLQKYKTRNEFFYRTLRPDVRPIAEQGNKHVIGSAADCRLMVFDNAEEAKRIWIKGQKFSIAALINPRNDKGESARLLTEQSSIAVFRLAPADYHRYHHPVGPVNVEGRLHAGQEYYTVNPDAVNENFDVFTGNTRDVRHLRWSPGSNANKDGFPVAFASIGALLVGSINLTNADEGKSYERGQEMGYFAYGGSTCIAVFAPDAKVQWDKDLKANSDKGIETLVKVNERIGISSAE